MVPLKDLVEIPETERPQADRAALVPKLPKNQAATSGSILLALTLVLILVIVGTVLLRRSRSAQVSAGMVTATVTRSDFIRSVRLSGTVEAINSVAVAAPRLAGANLGSLVVTKLAPSGKQVKKGDLLVQFDRQAQIKEALDQEATYVNFAEQVKKKQADQETAQASDESALRQAENAAKKATLDVQRNEILSKIDAEKNQLALEEANSTFLQLKKTFDLKRQSAKAELRSLEIQRDRARQAMEYARNNAGKLEIHAPIDGIVVFNTIWKGGRFGEVQEGDEVRAGVPFMQIVNSGAMQVRGRVNQADASLLQPGQPVRVGLDAYPDLSFPGKVQRVAVIGVTSGMSDHVRTFNALVSIDGSDARLLPDLSASLDVELQRIPAVLTVPRDAVVNSGREHYVMAWDGRAYSRRDVIVGAENDVAMVVSGIREGTRVLRNVNVRP